MTNSITTKNLTAKFTDLVKMAEGSKESSHVRAKGDGHEFTIYGYKKNSLATVFHKSNPDRKNDGTMMVAESLKKHLQSCPPHIQERGRVLLERFVSEDGNVKRNMTNKDILDISTTLKATAFDAARGKVPKDQVLGILQSHFDRRLEGTSDVVREQSKEILRPFTDENGKFIKPMSEKQLERIESDLREVSNFAESLSKVATALRDGENLGNVLRSELTTINTFLDTLDKAPQSELGKKGVEILSRPEIKLALAVVFGKELAENSRSHFGAMHVLERLMPKDDPDLDRMKAIGQEIEKTRGQEFEVASKEAGRFHKMQAEEDEVYVTGFTTDEYQSWKSDFADKVSDKVKEVAGIILAKFVGVEMNDEPHNDKIIVSREKHEEKLGNAVPLKQRLENLDGMIHDQLLKPLEEGKPEITHGSTIANDLMEGLGRALKHLN